MQTKLTLRLDRDLIEQAKTYSAKQNKSLSQIVADYFALLEAALTEQPLELTPLVSSLKGALRGSKVSEEDYQRHLEEKYL